MKLSDFDYILPQNRIAQFPLKKRDGTRLLVLHRKQKRMEHRSFRDLLDYLRSGDALVLNDTRVRRARLFGRKATGGKMEALLLRRVAPREYEALLSPGSRLRIGTPLFFGRWTAFLTGGNGTVKRIRFQKEGIETWMKKRGAVPLPPYIRRLPGRLDLSRYQTVYARAEGAAAAPTAGLHFTKGLLRKIEQKGVTLCPTTLHVGYGTFEPVRKEQIETHRLHEEYFEISPKSAALLNRVRENGGEIVAVGTTPCRVLETVLGNGGSFRPMKGRTDLFIYPPYRFQGVDALLTNFHLPKSSLLMLVAAFAGLPLIRQAYEEAIRKGYRFYSYGDAMLIL